MGSLPPVQGGHLQRPLFEYESDMNTVTRVPVLMYHRVGMANNQWEARYAIRPNDFVAHMETLARKGYRAVAADALVDWLGGGPPLPSGAEW